MKPSILRNILFAFVGLGLMMGLVFPFYASFFVNYKEGLYGWFVAGCLVAGLVIGVLNYYLLNFLLISKLKRIAKISTAISNHDLSSTCIMQSHDVIGDIINSFNKMANTLREIVGELKTSSTQIQHGVKQICVDSENNCNDIENQCKEIRNAETSIYRMTQISQEVSSKATEAAEAAIIAHEEASKGNLIVEQTVNSIKNLASAVESASQSINKVEAESTNIGGVLDVIQGISEQTNLLALNAAIEAARAGDLGRGFAVVADEVRTLAQRTQDSTKEIQDMINTLQSASRETVLVMEKGQTQAHKSVSHASEAGNSLQQITQAVQDITQLNTRINDEAGAQSGIVTEINQNMTNISQIASQSMEGAKRSNLESQELADLAGNLQELVAKFKM